MEFKNVNITRTNTLDINCIIDRLKGHKHVIADITDFPGTSGQNNKVLTVFNNVLAWVPFTTLPGVEGQAGKYLSNNGTSAIWKTIPVQEQADWNQANTSAFSYIKNKPTIPTALSQLANDIGYLLDTRILTINGISYNLQYDRTWTLTTSNINEGANLYFTQARARAAISLTTSGDSGAATYDNGTGILNIPEYTLDGLGGISSARTITINGVTYDLSANRSWVVGDVRTDGSYSNPSWLTSLAWSKISGTPTTASGYGITDVVLLTTNQTIAGNKTFSDATTLQGAVKVSYLSGGGDKLVQANVLGTLQDATGGTFAINISGNADTVTDGVYTSGSYANPTWITSLGWSKITGTPTTLFGYGISDAYTKGEVDTLLTSYLLISNFNSTFDARFAVKTTSDLAEGSNLYYTQSRFDSAFSAKSTTNLTEGTNLYFTDSRARGAVSVSNIGTSGAATYNSTTGIFNIPIYQEQGNYITALTGEVTASGPGAASATLSNSAVIGKVLTGLNLVGGGTISATDSILQAFGKVQNQISAMVGGVIYQGVWNASTNSPTITSSTGTKGHYYVVNVAGSTNIDGITDWKVGDWIIFNGTTWDKVDNTDAVSSVNGFTGAVSLTTANIPEVTNLYYTDARARAAISETITGIDYNNTTGVFSLTSGYVIPTTTQETNWTLAYTQTRQWDGGATGLNAATGRTSLGLGSMALENTSSYYTQTQINNFFSGTTAITGYNKSNWDNVYTWYSNNPLSGYLPLSGGTMTGSFGLNDTKLYLRTNGDNNHYLWNAGDDWEELNAYEGTGFRVTSNMGGTGLLYVYGASNGGYTYSPYSFRAPIFYDSNDTAFYADLSSGTNLRYLNVNGSWGSSPFASGHAQLNIAGTYPSITLRQTDLSQFYTLLHNNDAFYIYTGRGATNGVNWNWGLKVMASQDENYVEARTSLRAPIFYDSQDTGYYVDPNSTSVMNYVGSYRLYNHTLGTSYYFGAGSWGFRHQTPSGYIEFGPANTGHAHIYTDRSSFYFNATLIVNGGSTINTNDIRANIFYDSDDTGYYADFNSTSNSALRIRGGALFGPNPTWGAYLQVGGNGREGSYATVAATSGNLHLDPANGYSTYINYYSAGDIYFGSSGTYKISSNGSYYNGNVASADYSAYSNMDFLMSNRDFGSGTLVTTSINYAVSNGDPFILEIKGNSYGSAIPFDIQIQGYIYADTIISSGGYSNGTFISDIRAINNGGNLCFWWPRQAYWQGFTVKVYTAYGGRQINKVTSVSDSGLPTTAKQVIFNVYQSLRSDNYTNWACTRRGEGANYIDYAYGLYDAYRGGWRTSNDLYVAYAYSSGNADTVDGYHASNFLGKNGNSYYQQDTWIQSTGTHGLYAPSSGSGTHWYPGNTFTYGSWYLEGFKSGYLGILFYGTTGPVTIMYDSVGNGGVFQQGDDWHFYWAESNRCLAVNGSNTSSSYGLYVTKSIYSTENVVAYSDVRKKTNIVTIDNALEKVLSLRGVYYDKIGQEDLGRQTGVIAQEINEVLPEVVTYAADVDEYGVSYGNIVGVLIEAIKEQQDQIENLKKQIDYLVENR